MASYNKINVFLLDLASKVHNLGSDVLKVALCASAHAPVATNSQLTDLTEIAYTNLSSRALTVSSSAQSGGTYTLKISNLTLTASGGAVATFRYIAIYNDTSTNKKLIAWFDYGSDLTLNDGESLTLSFDSTNGLLQIA